MSLDDPKAEATKRLGGTVEGVGHQWNDRAIRFQQEQNAVEVSQKIAKLDEIKRDQVDPLLQLEGDQALTRDGFERGVIDEADKIYGDAYDEIVAELENPDQIQRFQIRFDSRRTEGMNQVAGHYAKQHQVVKQKAFEAGYSQAVLSVRTNVGDTAFFEDKLLEVKEDFNELHPGTNNGAVLDKMDQDMRVEYLKELMVVAPKLVDRQLDKWKDKIPASVAEQIKNSARTEGERQEANTLAGVALNIQATQGPEEAVKYIRENASSPEVGSKAGSLFNAQVSLEKRMADQAEKDALDKVNLDMMELWVNSPEKLTPDFILQSLPDANAQNWWLEKLTKGDSPTSMALKGDLLARAYGAKGTKPIESWDELLAYTNPDPGRPGQTLSMKDALSVWKTKLHMDFQKRQAGERDAQALVKYDRSKATQQGVSLLKDFAGQGVGGISIDNINETVADFHTWVSQNPDATGSDIIDKAKALGGEKVLDVAFDGWFGRPGDVYPKDVLSEQVGRTPGKVPWNEVVQGWDPSYKQQVTTIAEDMIAQQPGYRTMSDKLLYQIHEALTEEGVANYKPME